MTCSHWIKAQVHFNPYLTPALEGVGGQHHSLATLFPGRKDSIHCTRSWAEIEDGRNKSGEHRPHRSSNRKPYSESVYRQRHAGRLLYFYNSTKRKYSALHGRLLFRRPSFIASTVRSLKHKLTLEKIHRLHVYTSRDVLHINHSCNTALSLPLSVVLHRVGTSSLVDITRKIQRVKIRCN
jgi:hypothetical protein